MTKICFFHPFYFTSRELSEFHGVKCNFKTREVLVLVLFVCVVKSDSALTSDRGDKDF